jgi:TolB-like protein
MAQSRSRSVAVLPFSSFSPDPEDAFFAAGLHAEIISRLAMVPDLSVMARTSVLPYANASKPIRTVAEELNVRAVVDGSIRYDGGRVRIQAQLIDGQTDEHLWAEVYQRDFDDVFAIQAEIAEQIALAVDAEL